MSDSFKTPDFLLRPESTSHGVPETWAISYGDLITQLLVFFIVLLSASNVNGPKMEKVKQAMAGDVATPSSTEVVGKELIETLKRRGLSDFVTVTPDVDGITLVIKDSLLYASGEATIPEGNNARLEPVFTAFKELPGAYKFSIEGHTDDAPIANVQFASNWHLSSARALAVLELFLRQGFNPSRLSIRALGAQEPLVANRDSANQPIEKNRALNRRVVIRVR